MQVALMTTFRSSRKDPLAEVLAGVHGAFLASGAAPEIRFTFADAPVAGFVSSVDRVLKRYPALAAYLTEVSPVPTSPAVRQLTNRLESQRELAPVPFETLHAIASGVPRSFPVHNAQFVFLRPDFGAVTPLAVGPFTPGVVVGDAWWVNGRMRSVQAWMLVDGDPSSKRLPAPVESVQTVLTACGKVQKTTQLPLTPTPSGEQVTPAVRPEVAAAVHEVVTAYRARMPEVLASIAMPHDLPPVQEARANRTFEASGPRKPALVRAFKPMGYDCKGESGTFELRRRTANNLTLEISMDVGTWSRSVIAFFNVHGLGFSAMVNLPVSPRAGMGQYPIGDAEHWQQIVDNYQATVAELERSFVPAVEAAAGASPEWYRPES